MSFATCTYVNNKLVDKQDVLKDCDGNSIPKDTQVPTCTQMNTAITSAVSAEATARQDADALKQDKLKDCTGADLAANTQVPTCTQMNAAITNAVSAEETARQDADALKQDKLKDCAGNYLAADEQVAKCSELPAIVKSNETPTTFAVSGVNYVHTNELGVQTVLQPAQFISSDTGQSISTGSDGRLFVNVIGMLPPDNTYSGSNLGTVDITFEQDITDPTLYTVKADLNVAPQTPTNGTNLLKWSASGFYVSADEIEAQFGTLTQFQDNAGNNLFKAFV